MKLNSKQRKELEALANDLAPAIRLGKNGVTPTFVQSVRENLAAQELVKIKILDNATVDRNEVAEDLVGKTGAMLVRVIGRTIILFRPNPEKKGRILLSGSESGEENGEPAASGNRIPRDRPPMNRRGSSRRETEGIQKRSPGTEMRWKRKSSPIRR